MNSAYKRWYDLSVSDFLCQVSDSAPDQPPGAIGAVAVSLAVSAALLRKCTTDPELAATLDKLGSRALSVSILDGEAYDAWKRGDTDSEAIEKYPSEIESVANQLITIANTMKPNPITGMTDIVAAGRIAAGGLSAAATVREGNIGLL